MPKYAETTTATIAQLVRLAKGYADQDELDDTLGTDVGDYVDRELLCDDIRTICYDLAGEYGRGVDQGVLHRWGAGRTLADDLDQFASSLACELLVAAVRAQLRKAGS